MDIDKLSKWANIIIMFLTCMIATKACSWSDKLNAIEIETKLRKTSQDSVLFERELKFKIYDLSLAAIKSKDTIEQEAALLVVGAMVADTSFKKELLQLFIKSKSITPKIKDRATKNYKKQFGRSFSDEFSDEFQQ